MTLNCKTPLCRRRVRQGPISRYVLLFVSLLGFAIVDAAGAHDYWLRPERFLVSPGETTAVRLYVGDHLQMESERPFQAAMTARFQLVGVDDFRLDLAANAKDEQLPVATLAPPRAGTYLIAMERDWSYIEIEAPKFNDYLKHEGLESILELRRKTGEFDDVGRERYRRYLKALIQAGSETDATYALPLGHRLEILPQSNPSLSKVGDRLQVLVRFDGQPLAGAQVAALQRRGDQTHEQHLVTDAAGKLECQLDGAGMWLIRLVHMRRVNDDPKVDWESFWAAYSFALPAE
jgi:uncharacterized GH25 family protein